ncbi:guanylate kinase [Rurimicrobium arvi]|uniref:Guanylate kinase n=1 Tax=Rurimicrobium arvi TaxID=2049916 RepID=A0ABP8MNK4_9BACT
MSSHTSQKLIILAAPSGSGKTTLTNRLMQTFPQLAFSVSACTRPPRAGEVDGKDYHFISLEAFREGIANDDFVEWEMVYQGKYYGTRKSELQRLWDLGKIPILDIDVKGAVNVMRQFPENALTVFIQAPSIDALRERLQNRGTETEESLAERVNKAEEELDYASHFQHTIVNDHLEEAAAKLIGIVRDFLQEN